MACTNTNSVIALRPFDKRLMVPRVRRRGAGDCRLVSAGAAPYWMIGTRDFHELEAIGGTDERPLRRTNSMARAAAAGGPARSSYTVILMAALVTRYDGKTVNRDTDSVSVAVRCEDRAGVVGRWSMTLSNPQLFLEVQRPTGTSPTASGGAAVRAVAELLSNIVRSELPQGAADPDATWTVHATDSDLRALARRAADLDASGAGEPLLDEELDRFTA